MDQLLDTKNWYVKNFREFENSLNGTANKPIHKIRKAAIEKFSELNFPTLKDEEWRFTNISSLLKENFNPSLNRKNLSTKDVEPFTFNKMSGSLLVFVNGHFEKDLSVVRDLPAGAIVSNLSSEIENDSEIVAKHFGKYADFDNKIFTALSTAYTKDGAVIYVPDGKIIEEPIHVLFIADSKDEKILVQPRNLFIAGKNSQATILEHYAATEDGEYFTNSVTEIFVDENAVLQHVKLQEESINAFHIGRMEVDQERNSNFNSQLISFGGDISRNEFNSKFNDVGGECTLNGLYMTTGTQLFDAHTMIDHAKPFCNSHEHYKGILTDKSRGVFNGKVMVRQDAQKTNAFQENNNLILSNNALINTKPQLEIFADDVKCSHGATIGQLDDDSMFYLKSRGIGFDKARAILLHAFASEVISSIKIEAVKNYLEDILSSRFDQEN